MISVFKFTEYIKTWYIGFFLLIKCNRVVKLGIIYKSFFGEYLCFQWFDMRWGGC